ncbi:uncharacterized protein BO80DRAFT_425216 [Aspergillus ibericus CBS 121593]|uniref:Uncharacterized protein n=1 Tax=Aspergillus ibericus CBS 121593 TaxID=1448316 RepID=A0A395GZ17_9EURO|nr:hypothetical protein BO80DRAFT_425216 [Aspergillus ibericus CBS 121593]RAL00806.1 hypothetical protein BO80DRAFT_425216 [Aspergillus ibericus CBS 121593]
MIVVFGVEKILPVVLAGGGGGNPHRMKILRPSARGTIVGTNDLGCYMAPVSHR